MICAGEAPTGKFLKGRGVNLNVVSHVTALISSPTPLLWSAGVSKVTSVRDEILLQIGSICFMMDSVTCPDNETHFFKLSYGYFPKYWSRFSRSEIKIYDNQLEKNSS